MTTKMGQPRNTFIAPAPLCDIVYDKMQLPQMEYGSDRAQSRISSRASETDEDKKKKNESCDNASDTDSDRTNVSSNATSPNNNSHRTEISVNFSGVNAVPDISDAARASRRTRGGPSKTDSFKKSSQKTRHSSLLSARTASTVSMASVASSASAASSHSIRSISTIQSASSIVSVSSSSLVRRNKTRVWFGSMQVNEHLYTLGDNPSVSEGAPLTISWQPHRQTTYEVEYYETYNPSEKRRGVKTGLKLTADQRHMLLLSAGYSMAEIVACSLEIQRQKKKREESVRNKKWDGVHATIENTTRKLRKVTSRRGSLRGSTTAGAASPVVKSSKKPSSSLSTPTKSMGGGRLGSSLSSLPLLSPRKNKDTSSAFKRGASTSVLTVEPLDGSLSQIQWTRN